MELSVDDYLLLSIVLTVVGYLFIVVFKDLGFLVPYVMGLALAFAVIAFIKNNYE